MSHQQPNSHSQESRRPSTVLESVAELREQIRRGRTVDESASPPGAHPAEDDTLVFRPTHRPTMAVLYVLDDGCQESEVIRIRGDLFVIGRAEGDLVIPHDDALSGRHLEISRRLENGHFRWYLKDLGSSNGTFVRVASALLSHEQVIVIGSRSYRFEAVMPGSAAWGPSAAGRPTPSTRRLLPDPSSDADAGQIPALVELSVSGGTRRCPLNHAEVWFGRSPQKSSLVLDDPMVSPRHGCLRRDSKGRWRVDNAGSLNGVWLRIQELPLDRSGYFQCGEQRFAIKIP